MNKFLLFLLCACSFGLMFHAARTDSAVVDERAHIPAGYAYVHNFDYRLNPEHPPLVKALAMTPVLFLHPAFNTESTAWTTELNGQWDMGTQFLYLTGNNADAIIQTGRVVPILITILTIIFIFLLSRELLGEWWALLPAFLFALDPLVLGQGHYVTTDMGATFGVVFSLYFFFKFIKRPTAKHLWLAGIAFGVAELTKFSTPLLIPLFLFLAIVLWAREMALEWHEIARRGKTFFLKLVKHLWRVLLIFIIGYFIIVYPAYLLFTAHEPIARQVADTQALLAPYASVTAGGVCPEMRCFATADIWMAKNPALRPFGEYLLGILMALRRVNGDNTIYFLGHVVGTGGWIYFPLIFLLKEPLPSLIIIFFALILAIWWAIKRARAEGGHSGRAFLDYIGSHFAEFSMASFIVLYWGYSMHSPLNIGLRHILPTLPLIFILAACVWKQWMTRLDLAAMIRSAGSVVRIFLRAALKYIFLLALLVWLFAESAFAAPYFLSYFNEVGGGVWNGYHYVTDSNYDWGQDLIRLKAWADANPQADKIAVDYFGGGDPAYYLGKDREVNWSSAQGNPADQGIHWLVISVNTLEGAIQPLAPGQFRNASDTYAWLTALRPPAPGMGNVPPPDARAGTSLFIYHL